MTPAQSLAVHLQFARCSFQRLTAYRLANWTGISVNFFFFLVHAQVYLAFFGARAEVAGWAPEQAILYLASVESLLMVVGVFPIQTGYDFPERVRTGAIAADLVRPVSLYARSLAERFGSAAYYLALRAIPLYAGALAFWTLAPPLRAELIWFPLSLCLAIAIGGLLAYLAHATAYWLEGARAAIHALTLLLIIFGGSAVPLDFYPDALRSLCDALPFRGVVYAPVALAAGRLAGAELAFSLAHQVAWTALLLWLSRAVERAGLRRLVAHGG